jgi:hypothetical protein
MMHKLIEFDEKYTKFLNDFYHGKTTRNFFNEIFGEENTKNLGKIAYKIYANNNIDEETYKEFSSFIPKINIYYEYKAEQAAEEAERETSDKSQIDQKIIGLVKDKKLTDEFKEILKELNSIFAPKIKTEINKYYHHSFKTALKISYTAANIISDFDPLWKTGSEFLFKDILDGRNYLDLSPFSEKVSRLSSADSIASDKKLDYEYLKLGHALLLLKKYGKEKIKDQLQTALLTAIELQKKNDQEKKYPDLISAMREWMLHPNLEASRNLVQLIRECENDEEFIKLTRVKEPVIYRGTKLDPEVWLTKDEYEIFKTSGTFTLKNISFKHRTFPGTSWTRNIDVAERLFSKSYTKDIVPCIAKAKTSNNDESLFDLKHLQRLSDKDIELYYETEVFAVGTIICDITFTTPDKSKYEDDDD